MNYLRRYPWVRFIVWIVAGIVLGSIIGVVFGILFGIPINWTRAVVVVLLAAEGITYIITGREWGVRKKV
jgi:hypothetical protein